MCDQDDRVVKVLDLRSSGQMSSWVQTPLLVSLHKFSMKQIKAFRSKAQLLRQC